MNEYIQINHNKILFNMSKSMWYPLYNPPIIVSRSTTSGVLYIWG